MTQKRMTPSYCSLLQLVLFVCFTGSTTPIRGLLTFISSHGFTLILRLCVRVCQIQYPDTGGVKLHPSSAGWGGCRYLSLEPAHLPAHVQGTSKSSVYGHSGLLCLLCQMMYINMMVYPPERCFWMHLARVTMLCYRSVALFGCTVLFFVSDWVHYAVQTSNWMQCVFFLTW